MYLSVIKEDIETVKNNPTPLEGICPMMILGKVYTERETARNAIIEQCKISVLKDNPPIELGSYKGFGLQLGYDRFSESFKLNLVGKKVLFY